MNRIGALGYLGLKEWWDSYFTLKEKTVISEMYRARNIDAAEYLYKLPIVDMGTSPSHFLASIGVMLVDRKELPLSIKTFDGAVNHARNEMERFEVYRLQIKVFYRWRKEPGFLDLTMQACREQMELDRNSVVENTIEWAKNKGLQLTGLFGHDGYSQLAVILEKQGNLEDAISLCDEALSKGWDGDYERRRERLKRKLAKQQ